MGNFLRTFREVLSPALNQSGCEPLKLGKYIAFVYFIHVYSNTNKGCILPNPLPASQD